MEQLVESFLSWVHAHPNWAGIVVFLISVLESLLIVGLFIPGTIVMFGIGAMVAAGQMALVPTLLWAAAGAIVGDAISFYIGRHYHQQLRVIWPLNRFPELMTQGISFFHAHGGKSVLFARFVGPVRPLVPAIAGMLDMPPSRFFPVSILSAIIWAPAYMLPGIVLGASLGIVAQVAGRLAILAGLVIGLLWFSWWSIRRLSRLLQPRAKNLQSNFLNWGRQLRITRPLTEALLDPKHAEASGMTVLTLLLLTASWLFLILAQHPSPDTLLGNMDLYLFNQLQELRNPWGDQFFLIITRIASAPMLVIFTALVGSWFIWNKHWQALIHWVVTIVCVGGLTFLVKKSTEISRPIAYLNETIGYSFPSAHASLTIATFGFLAVLVARETPDKWHWLPYTFAGLLVVLVSFSRLYLGAHWFSDIAGGLSLGIAWVALMGIAYRSHHSQPVATRALLPVILLSFFVIALLGNLKPVGSDLADYQSAPDKQTLSLNQWLKTGWQQMPSMRYDMKAQHKHPMNIQWVSSLDEIRSLLESMNGWKPATKFSVSTLFELFEKNPDIDSLPVFSQIHNGKNPVLVYYKLTANPDRIRVLRIWASNTEIDGNAVWIGNIGYLKKQAFYLFTVLATDTDFKTPLDNFLNDLTALSHSGKTPRIETRKLSQSDRLLLLSSPDSIQ